MSERSTADLAEMLEMLASELESSAVREAAARLREQKAELMHLRSAVDTVVCQFKRDEAQGFRSRDRKYAIDILSAALSAPHAVYEMYTQPQNPQKD